LYVKDSNSILVDDFNNDQKKDILLLGNLYSSEVEIPRNDISYDYLLKGKQNRVFFRDSYRGIWKLHNGFMGGPIVIKPYFLDENIVITAALVFNPQSTKRKYIKEFEATL